jgi:hypothetical protein
MVETNGNIKLSWQQIVWGISLISVILLTYSDLKNRVVLLTDQLHNVYSKAESDQIIYRLEQEDKAIRRELRVLDKKLGVEPGE